MRGLRGVLGRQGWMAGLEESLHGWAQLKHLDGVWKHDDMDLPYPSQFVFLRDVPGISSRGNERNDFAQQLDIRALQTSHPLQNTGSFFVYKV
jgi:hypothetical protein